jgi:Outer membrane lipoprotein-sorting protein
MNSSHRLFLGAIVLAWVTAVAIRAQEASLVSEAVAVRVVAAGADPEAEALAHQIADQSPSQGSVLYGSLKIRTPEGRRVSVPVKYTIVPGTNEWRGIYEAQPTPWRGAERLVVIHRAGQPNRYEHAAAGGPGQLPKAAVTLATDQAYVPFGGSEFSLIDLGLDFLHWPEQRLLRDAKIKVRSTRTCHVLESRAPASLTAAGGYERVVSWLDTETGAPVYAEAFDRSGQRVKVFSLRGFTKAEGRWQPKELEMVNERLDSKSVLEFNYERP